MKKEEFLQRIRQEFPFSIKGDIEDVVEIVLTSLRKHVGFGEAEDVISILPKDIRELVGNLFKVNCFVKRKEANMDQAIKDSLDCYRICLETITYTEGS